MEFLVHEINHLNMVLQLLSISLALKVLLLGAQAQWFLPHPTPLFANDFVTESLYNLRVNGRSHTKEIYQVIHRDPGLVQFHLILFCFGEFGLQFPLVFDHSTIFGLYHIIHKIQLQFSRLSHSDQPKLLFLPFSGNFWLHCSQKSVCLVHVCSVNAGWGREDTCTFFLQ